MPNGSGTEVTSLSTWYPSLVKFGALMQNCEQKILGEGNGASFTGRSSTCSILPNIVFSASAASYFKSCFSLTSFSNPLCRFLPFSILLRLIDCSQFALSAAVFLHARFFSSLRCGCLLDSNYHLCLCLWSAPKVQFPSSLCASIFHRR